jgi:hypothetical protein
MTDDTTPPRWKRWSEIPSVMRHGPYARRTLLVAGVVGTVLFSINQLDVVLAGAATPRTWAKIALTFVVPWVVSNYGLLVASRDRAP